MHTRFGSRSAVAIVIGMLMVGSVATPVAADAGSVTRWVDDDGHAGPSGCASSKAAKSTIQSAVNASDTNDVVIVCPGTYTGDVRIGGQRNGLTVRASSSWTAVVRAPADVQDALILVDGPDRVTIQGLKLVFPTTGCDSRPGDVDGIAGVGADRLTVRGNQLRPTGSDTKGSCGYDDGIQVFESNSVLVHSNLVQDFKSEGVRFDEGSSGTIRGNSIRFDHASEAPDDGDAGIGLFFASPVVVAANVIRSLPTAGTTTPNLEVGIVLIASGDAIVRDNDVRMAWFALYVSSSDDLTIRDNDVKGVSQASGAGIYVQVGTGSQVRDNRIRRFDSGLVIQGGGNSFRQRL